LYIQATPKRVLINPEWFWFFDPLSWRLFYGFSFGKIYSALPKLLFKGFDFPQISTIIRVACGIQSKETKIIKNNMNLVKKLIQDAGIICFGGYP